MAVQKQNLDLTSSLTIIRDTDSDATSEDNVNSGAAVLYLLSVNNSANSGTRVHLKMYDATSATIGTTAPDMIIGVPGGATVTMSVPEGLSFATGLSYATVTEAGTAGTTSPTGNVSVVLVVS